MASSPVDIAVYTATDPQMAAHIHALAERVTEHDGTPPLSEATLLSSRPPATGAHVLATRGDGDLLGYAHLRGMSSALGSRVPPTAELTVDPIARRQGIGRTLVDTVISLAPGGAVEIWAHGQHEAAAHLAAAMDFVPGRTLWTMRRDLADPLPAASLPDGVEVREFRVDADADAWLALNARTFERLPDQGGWTRADLDSRLAEPWFSTDGFLVAWRGASMVGFHWTKVHPAEHGHRAVGEVYVIGVDERGSGLGRALTILGIEHLRAQGLDEVLLYVDAENAPAIGLYGSLGFRRTGSDVLYSHLG